MVLQFFKYQGTGNDFIIIDNPVNNIHLTKDQVAFMCNRRFGIGADGLMLLNYLEGYDFQMVYFNSDGNESSMCGNGGRCLVRFAYDIGLKKNDYYFLAIDGPHHASIQASGWVDLKMKDVDKIAKVNNDFILNTGSPHYIQISTDVQQLDVYAEGRKIRYSDEFSKEGVNVNFVQMVDKDIYIRTYERGVEDETLSCGTGVTAAALVCSKNEGSNIINIQTPGGRLEVKFNKEGNFFTEIWLCGPANYVYKGEIKIPDAIKA